MNRRYMDFVPSRQKKVPVRKVMKTSSRSEREVEEVRPKIQVEKKVVKKRPVSYGDTTKLGVIEDLGPKFIETNVAKRPLLEQSHFAARAGTASEAKAKKVGNREDTGNKNEMESGMKLKGESKETFKTPKSPFINQDKVEKRPLSKNVYPKKEIVVREEPKGPVTIIEKPDKDSKIGLIITIILTIILGAAAGTVAFLLLPK